MADVENNDQDQAAIGQENEQQEQEQPLQCTVEVADAGPWKKKISLEIPREEIDSHH